MQATNANFKNYAEISKKIVYANTTQKSVGAGTTTNIWSYTSVSGGDVINLDANSYLYTHESGAVGYGVTARINGSLVEGLIYSENYKDGARDASMQLHADIYLPSPADYLIVYLSTSTASVTLKTSLMYANKPGTFY